MKPYLLLCECVFRLFTLSRGPSLTILNYFSFHRSARYYSELLRDQPDTPYDRFVFWTEYIIRRKGAHHLRTSPMKLHVGYYFISELLIMALFVLTALIFASSCVIITVRKLSLSKKIPQKKSE